MSGVVTFFLLVTCVFPSWGTLQLIGHELFDRYLGLLQLQIITSALLVLNYFLRYFEFRTKIAKMIRKFYFLP